MKPTWNPGDWAVYRKSKWSSVPGRRASSVKANQKGETYNYVVDKFWIVESVLPGNRLLMRTAGGKSHLIDSDDPNLRRPSFLQRLLRRERYHRVTRVMNNSPHFAA